MKMAEEFRMAYGSADENFCRCVTDTLAELQREEKRSNVKLRWSMVLAAVLVLMAAVGIAAVSGRWGLVEFLNKDGYWGGKERQSNETAINVIPPMEKTETVTDGVAEYWVSQSVHDGVYVYLTVQANPLQNDYLLIGERMTVDNSALFLNSAGLGDEMTIGEYASLQEKKVANVIAEDMHCLDMQLNEDGSSTLLLAKYVYGSAHHPDVYVCAVPDDTDMEDIQRRTYQEKNRAKLAYHVTLVDVQNEYVAMEEADFGGFFPEKCRVNVFSTGITNYARVSWKGEVDETDCWYRFSVVNGAEIEYGATGLLKEQGEDWRLVSFAADEIGSELTLEVTKTTWGEPVYDEKTGSYARSGIEEEKRTHTFSLRRKEK